MSLSRSMSVSIVGFVAALALAGALMPAFASAQTATYYNPNGNCPLYPATGYSTVYPYSNTYPVNGNYPYGYPYNNNGYQNGYCQGNLFVYVQVNAPTNSFYNQQPSNFSVTISGATAYPQTFPGNTNGQMVSVVGTYSVTAASYQGFTPSYSSGCSGSLVQGQQTTCVITETPTYPYNYQPNNYYQNQYPYIQPYVAPYVAPTPTVYVTPSYVPSLPNTGFEPNSLFENGAAIAFAVVALIAMAFIGLPYVRKAFAAILG